MSTNSRTTTAGTATAATLTTAGAGSDPDPWFIKREAPPPAVDHGFMAQVRERCSAEVGDAQLVTQVDDGEEARLRVSMAQYSPGRVAACARALEAEGTAVGKAVAVDLERQVSDIAELGMTARAHLSAESSYSTTIAKRAAYAMEVTRDHEERILLAGAQERVKAAPDPKILTAASLVEAARQREAGRRQATQQDHESRTSEKDATIARLERDLEQLRKMNEELVQGLSRVKAELMAKDAGSALGGSAASSSASSSSSESAAGIKSGDRRQSGGR